MKKYEDNAALAWAKARHTFNKRGPELTYELKRSSASQMLPESSGSLAGTSVTPAFAEEVATVTNQTVTIGVSKKKRKATKLDDTGEVQELGSPK